MEAVTGIAGAVVFAVESAQKLKSLIGELKDVPDDIRDLGANLDALNSILKGAQRLCSQDDFKNADALLVENISQCVRQCGDSSERLRDQLISLKGKGPGSRIAWVWRKTDRQRLKIRLFESRDNLDTAVLVMNGYVIRWYDPIDIFA